MAEQRRKLSEKELERRRAARRARQRKKRIKKRLKQIAVIALIVVLVIIAVKAVPAVVRKVRERKAAEAGYVDDREAVGMDSAKTLHLVFPTLYTPPEDEGGSGQTAALEPTTDLEAAETGETEAGDGEAAEAGAEGEDTAEGETAEDESAEGESAEGESAEGESPDGESAEETGEDGETPVVTPEPEPEIDPLTVKEFRQILKQLYEDDYVLVSFYSQVSVSEDGITRAQVPVPAGKKPLIISQCDIRYGEGGDGYPTSLHLDGSGNLINEYVRRDGIRMTGSYDVVPVLEDFLREHPDFSFQGTRGLIGLSGEGGTYGLSGGAGNRLGELVTTLRSMGWNFACNGYSGVSYGSTTELVKEDIEKWQKTIGQVLGTTDILFFPASSDIGRWSGYTEDNEKFTLLSGLGFRYFLVDDNGNRSFMQVKQNYMRQVVHEIDSYDEFNEVMQLD